MVTEDVSLVLAPARVVLVVVEWTGVVVSPPRATQPLLSVVIFTLLFLRKNQINMYKYKCLCQITLDHLATMVSGMSMN